ncbi:MAG: hypothetical protein AB1761_17785 [Pseudomonadota bacterium]
MPMFQVKDGETRKRVRKLHVRDGTQWKEVRKGFVNDGGVRKQFYTAAEPINLTISADTANYNIWNAVVAALGAAPTDVVEVIVTVGAGVVVYSNSTAQAAMDTGTGWPANSTLRVINNGYIVGASGAGGAGGSPGFSGVAGAAGGPALNLQYPMTFTNTVGYLYGGGGGAGGWRRRRHLWPLRRRRWRWWTRLRGRSGRPCGAGQWLRHLLRASACGRSAGQLRRHWQWWAGWRVVADDRPDWRPDNADQLWRSRWRCWRLWFPRRGVWERPLRS